MSESIVMDLKQFVAENKEYETRTHYICYCPECEDINSHGPKLYILKNFSMGFCQRCHAKFINKSYNKLGSSVDNLYTPDFNCLSLNNEFIIDKIDLDYFNYSQDNNEECESYLNNRLPNYLIDKNKIGFKFRNKKVLIPFYWNGELIYYQVRKVLDRSKTKENPYFNPPIKHKPIYVSPLNKKENTSLILVEGVFGALSAGYRYPNCNVVAILGSYLLPFHLWMIEQLNYEKLILYFDNDEINRNIYETLLSRSKLIYENTKFIHSKNGDPEDDYKEWLKENL